MSRAQKDIANRLELTREALGLSAVDLCHEAGLGTTQWSNNVNPDGDDTRRITIDSVYKLKDKYGITFEWIYTGDPTRLPSDTRERIRQIERAGGVDLTRKRGRRPKKQA